MKHTYSDKLGRKLGVEPSADKHIPVLVVSGFLGSGKTTLVCHLLKEAQAEGTRIAIVSNEFGLLSAPRITKSTHSGCGTQSSNA
jgi:cobalamin biosynthesis protein CobW